VDFTELKDSKMSALIKIAVAGCQGRMGKELVNEIVKDESVALVAATVSKQSEMSSQEVGRLVGIPALTLKAVSDLSEAADFDVLIDFTTPDASMSHLHWCVEQHKKMVIGTTGFNVAQLESMKQASQHIAVLHAPNTSLGVNVMLKLIKEALSLIHPTSTIAILEKHHQFKKDAPSGTALQIAQTMAEIRNTDDKAFEIHSIRSGNMIGEHSVLFGLENETLEITHQVQNRCVFAKGALQAAKWLSDQSIGLYSMQNVIEKAEF